MSNYNIIVTGNGFDLALGLPTKYENFYETILKAIEKFGTQNENLSSFEKRVAELLRNNIFLKYIINTKIIFERWCDFEDELDNILKTFDCVFSEKIILSVNEPNLLEFDLGQLISVNLFDKKIVGKWKDLFLTISPSYKGNIYLEKNSSKSLFGAKENEKLIKEKVFKYLNDDLDDFKLLFIQYLNNISNVEFNATNALPKANVVFTYNYTDFSSSLCFNNSGFFHIHGKCDNSEIVLGVDGSPKFKNKELIGFTKLTQRSMLLDSIDFSVLDNYNDAYCSIAYFGLSFDRSDGQTIKDFFAIRRAHHYIYYFDKNAKKDIIVNLQYILGEENYSNLFKNKRITFIQARKFFEPE